MRWSKLIGAPVAAVFLCLGAQGEPALAQVMTAIPTVAAAPLSPLEITDVRAITALVLLSSQGDWHTDQPASAEPLAIELQAEVAEFEDHTPTQSQAAACHAFGSPLEIILALAGETVGGRLVRQVYDDYVAAMELAAWSVDFGYEYGFDRGNEATAPLAAAETNSGNSAELANDPRHSLGNHDALAINHREGNTVAVAGPAQFAPIRDFYANSWLDGVVADDCGGLTMPIQGIFARPAPAAALDASELAAVVSDAAQPSQTAAVSVGSAAESLPVNQLQTFVAVRGAQQLVEATAVILEHIGSGLVDLARVLRPQNTPPAESNADDQQASAMPGDLHLGL